MDLSGPVAERVWALSVQAAQLLDARHAALVELRRSAFVVVPIPPPPPARPAGSAPPIAPPRPVSPGVPLQPAREPLPAPEAVPRLPQPSLLRRVGMQVVLVGLGALLLAVSVVVFLVMSWDRLSLGGRATIVGALTLAALGTSWKLRSELRATAEAVGALGVVMVLADAWAIRGMGLFGADQVDAWAYAGLAAAGCAVVLGGWGWAGGVRAGTIAGAVLAPAAPILAGVYVVHRGDAWGRLGLAALLAVLVTALRLGSSNEHRAERVVLRVWAATGLGVTAVVCLILSVRDRQATAAGLLVLAAVAAAVQARCDLPLGGVGLRRWWSGAAGAALTSAALPAALGLIEAGSGDDSWVTALAPALAGAVVLGFVRAAPVLHGFGVRGRALITAAGAVLCALAVPAVAMAVAWSMLVVVAPLRPWRASAGTALAQVLPLGDLAGADRMPGYAARVLGVAALAVTAAVATRVGGVAAARLRRSRLDGWAAAAGWAAAMSACLAPALPLWVVTALLGLVTVAGAAVIARGPAARASVRAAAGVAAVTGTLAVLVAWNVDTLSGPATLAGIAALLLARRPAGISAPRIRPVLVGLAAAALAPAAGAAVALADRSLADQITGAGLALAAAAVPLVGVRSWPQRLPRPAGPALSLPERLVAVAVCLGGLAIAVAMVTGGSGGPGPLRQAGLLAAALVVAVVAVVRADGPFAASGGAVAAAALPVLVALLALDLHAGDVLALPGPIILAVTAAATALLVAGLVLAGPQASKGDPRRLPAEVSAAVVGVSALLVTHDGERGWIVLLVLGAGVSALSALPDRRWLGWLAGVLLTASSWVRLGLADVGLVEAYTLPPAAALLAVGALRLRRERAAGPWPALAPGFSLACLPSLMVSLSGEPVRAWALLALAAVAVAAGLAVAAVRDLGVPGAAAAVVACGVGAGRPAAALAERRYEVADVELWSLPAAAVLLGAGLLLARTPFTRTPWRRSLSVDEREPAGRSLLPVGWAEVPAVVLALGVVVLAAADQALLRGGVDVQLAEGAGTAVWRCVAVLATAVVVAAAASVRRAHRVRPVPLEAAPLVPAVIAAACGWLIAAWPVEVWAIPLAGSLLVSGAVRLIRIPALRSWPAVSPGLLIFLLPSLWAGSITGGTVRIVWLVVAGAAVVVTGAVRRLQGPLVLGSVALAVHAVVQLGPWIGQFAETVPRWVVLSVAGALLLTLGTTYERRLKQVRDVRLLIAAMR